GHHTVAVVAAALAMKGRPRIPAAATASDPRIAERLLSLRMPILLALPFVPRIVSESASYLFCKNVGRRRTSVANIGALIRAGTRLSRLSYSKSPLLQCSHAGMPLLIWASCAWPSWPHSSSVGTFVKGHSGCGSAARLMLSLGR